MSKETIKQLVNDSIEGQGNQVDVGGKLGKILRDIIDEIPCPAPEQEQADWDEADTISPAYIKNKPTIPAAQVQSDWNEADSESPAYIKNKPTINAQAQSDFDQTDTTKPDYIKNKPYIVSYLSAKKLNGISGGAQSLSLDQIGTFLGITREQYYKLVSSAGFFTINESQSTSKLFMFAVEEGSVTPTILNPQVGTVILKLVCGAKTISVVVANGGFFDINCNF